MKCLLRSGALLLLICSVSSAQPKWFVYTAPDKNFSVELPWKPGYDRRTFTTFVPDVRQRVELFKGTNYLDHYDLGRFGSETATFFIDVYDVRIRSDDKEFDERVESLVSRLGGKDKQTLKSESVTVNGLHGRDCIYEKGKSSGRMLFVNAGSRVYVLHFHTEDGKGTSRPSVERVFNTFQPKP